MTEMNNLIKMTLLFLGIVTGVYLGYMWAVVHILMGVK